MPVNGHQGSGDNPGNGGLTSESNPMMAEKTAGENVADQQLTAEEEQKLLAPVGEEVVIDKNPQSKKEEAEMPSTENHEVYVSFDKYHIVYFILMLHGVGTLMPWNMFITAFSYFTEYKLKPPEFLPVMGDMNVTTSSVVYNVSVQDEEEIDSSSDLYRRYFLSYLGFVAQIPNVLLNAINLFCQVQGGNISLRIIWSIIIVVVMFIFTVILAMVDTSQSIPMFFWLTMFSVVIINMANGVYQNSVYGTAAVLPMKYTNAVVLGSNISGTLTSVIAIIAKASAPDLRSAAIYYFLTAIFVLLLAFDTYFALPLLDFYKYYKRKAEMEQERQIQASGYQRPPFVHIFKQGWVQFVGVWFVFFVTLTCFPAIQAGIRRSDPNFPIPDKFYTEVTCFLFFNAFAMLGNLLTEFVKRPGPRWVWLPILLRGLFIPFFMFCNFFPKGDNPQRALPIFFNNDYVYSIGSILMAFTSGYFSSLTMMYAPRQVKEPEYQGVAGMMAAFFLILGIFSGVIFSFPVTIFIEKVGSSMISLPSLTTTTTAAISQTVTAAATTISL